MSVQPFLSQIALEGRLLDIPTVWELVAQTIEVIRVDVVFNSPGLWPDFLGRSECLRTSKAFDGYSGWCVDLLRMQRLNIAGSK